MAASAGGMPSSRDPVPPSKKWIGASASRGNAAASAERRKASFGAAITTNRFSTPWVRARWSAMRKAVLMPP